jgi:hypothetical protein
VFLFGGVLIAGDLEFRRHPQKSVSTFR